MKITWNIPGRMISGTKSGYLLNNPDHEVVFNANVCTEAGERIWYGDLDLTLDDAALVELATMRNEPILVLRERHARFEHMAKPKIEWAVARYTSSGRDQSWLDQSKQG